MADGKTKGDWRSSSNRRPSAFGGDRDDRDMPRPPSMSRSRAQLATAYAPGVYLSGGQ